MKKIKLITSLSSLGALSALAPVMLTSCSSLQKVTVTDDVWVNGSWSVQSTLAVGTKYYFASASSTFDNATFQEMLLANGAYKIEDIGSDSTLHYTLATVSPMGMGPFTVPSIQPANSGAHNLKLKVTLNNSKGEAGDTYEVSCAVTVSA